MTVMDPKAAAEAIADDWHAEQSRIGHDERHRVNFLEEVCRNLAAEPNAVNVSHVAHLLAKHGIERHEPDEYPKALNERRDGKLVPVMWPQDHPLAGTPVVFASAEEEAGHHGEVVSPSASPSWLPTPNVDPVAHGQKFHGVIDPPVEKP